MLNSSIEYLATDSSPLSSRLLCHFLLKESSHAVSPFNLDSALFIRPFSFARQLAFDLFSRHYSPGNLSCTPARVDHDASLVLSLHIDHDASLVLSLHIDHEKILFC